MYSDTLRETARYFKETEEGQEKMCKVWDEVRQEGIEMGYEIGLKCLVDTLKPILGDFENVYNAVIGNEAYKSVSREDIMKYYY
ncbi:MAG: hypothetical protein IJZ82_12865 [Lachnospiraceae bacterium]|nr:hypothetical protein [Lachnospiraceae bacterium]